MERYIYLTIIAIAAVFFLHVQQGRVQLSVHDLDTPSSTGLFSGVSLSMEYATTAPARAIGLGNRPRLPDHYGMLFVFPEDDYHGFWMKDTLVPLDMFWLDSKGQVISIARNVATSTYPNVFYPSAPARYVLETAAGFAERYNVATGTPLLLQNWPDISQ